MTKTIYHITTQAAWATAQKVGAYRDASLENEGFIHNSTKEQVSQTLERHFKGKTDLLLLEIDVSVVEPILKYEEAHGELFPHIYGEIPLKAIISTNKIQESK